MREEFFLPFLLTKTSLLSADCPWYIVNCKDAKNAKQSNVGAADTGRLNAMKFLLRDNPPACACACLPRYGAGTAHADRCKLVLSPSTVLRVDFAERISGLGDGAVSPWLHILGVTRKKRVTCVTRRRKKAAITRKNGIAGARPEAPNASPTCHQRVTESYFVRHIATSALRSMSHYGSMEAQEETLCAK